MVIGQSFHSACLFAAGIPGIPLSTGERDSGGACATAGILSDCRVAIIFAIKAPVQPQGQRCNVLPTGGETLVVEITGPVAGLLPASGRFGCPYGGELQVGGAFPGERRCRIQRGGTVTKLSDLIPDRADRNLQPASVR